MTELHRKKGDNAQQVIDLSSIVKGNEAVIVEKQTMIESLEAELLGVRDDLKSMESQMAELESTNQLLKVGNLRLSNTQLRFERHLSVLSVSNYVG